MNGNQGLFGLMMRHGGANGFSEHMHDTGPSSIEWAILGIVIAILVVVLLLLADRCRHRRYHRRHGWEQHGTPDEPLTIVRTRYARGELTREEYLQSPDDLRCAARRKEGAGKHDLGDQAATPARAQAARKLADPKRAAPAPCAAHGPGTVLSRPPAIARVEERARIDRPACRCARARRRRGRRARQACGSVRPRPS